MILSLFVIFFFILIILYYSMNTIRVSLSRTNS
ncbi:hypothetical protein GX50_08983 [[Emmonsia] crescens]|uniref:Uncharacterized protein n=1 Tax=[Emmonsia] crescens TaxID=73230 RepID=A0A2B7YS71_9EURO|nr:hypothetical protein GX50_08983 [Emmonsia crescens]